jgi:hypothetical protein
MASAGCTKGTSVVHRLALDVPNPTSYDFAVPVAVAHDRAKEAFAAIDAPDAVFGHRPSRALGSDEVSYASHFSVEDGSDPVFSQSVFRDPANVNDVYVHTFHTPIVASSVYRGRHGGLPFIGAFQIHMVALDENHTRVTVVAHDTEILNGLAWGIGSCGPGYGWRHQRVPPTSIEEYAMLRHLANALGASGLPPPHVPSRG